MQGATIHFAVSLHQNPLTMKSISRYLLYIAVAAVAAGCHHEHDHDHDHDHGHDHGHEHAHEAEAPEHKHEHPGIIELHDHAAERFGVRLDTLRPGNFNTVVRASGTVTQASGERGTVSAPTAGIVRFAPGISAGSEVGKGAAIAYIDGTSVSGGDSNAAAKARLQAAEAELKRVEALAAERLATQGELIAARAELESARAAYSPAASSGRATAPLAGVVTSLLVDPGAFVAVGQPIATIGKGGGTVLRVDLPSRYFAEAPTFTDLVADFPAGGSLRISATGGRRLGSAPAGSPESTGAYIPVYFTAPAASVAAGTPFTAYLIGADRTGVLSVPRTALSEQQGRFFIYRFVKPEHFEKLPVDVLSTDGERAEIAGLPEGTVYVADGVTAVRLAETSAVAPQGHTHNH